MYRSTKQIGKIMGSGGPYRQYLCEAGIHPDPSDWQGVSGFIVAENILRDVISHIEARGPLTIPTESKLKLHSRAVIALAEISAT